ncbi:MAG TPA: hypothetical protein VM573_06055 [Actinomycetota bacterium]|nr:hypothetical protein [Actinomycetota bacterium]
MANPPAPASSEHLETEYRALINRTLEIFRTRDTSLIGSAYTSHSPLNDQLRQAVAGLHKRDVVDDSVINIVNLEVVRLSSNRAELREVAVVYPCFVHPTTGEDLTTGPRAIQQTNNVVLLKEEGAWQIHEHRTLRERVLKNEEPKCATS